MSAYIKKLKPFQIRFWLKVNKDGQIPKHAPELGRCWEWMGAKNLPPSLPYGRIMRNGIVVQAHRISWELTFGAIPFNLCICHKCDNPSCVNPDHLFCGTMADNISDRDKKGRTAMGANSGPVKHPEKMARGEQVGNSKLTSSQVLTMRDLYQPNKFGTRKLAKVFGVASATVYSVVKRRTWAHV
jgi:hypothetical protein